jgi:hypothetical protein
MKHEEPNDIQTEPPHSTLILLLSVYKSGKGEGDIAKQMKQMTWCVNTNKKQQHCLHLNSTFSHQP